MNHQRLNTQSSKGGVMHNLSRFKMGKKRLLVKIARVLNYFSCLLMLGDAGYRIYDVFDPKVDEEPLFYILTCYLFGFAALLTTAEFRQRSVIMHFELLGGRGGKGIFVILVGLLIFDDERKLDIALANVLILIGIYNIVVACMRQDVKKRY